MSFFKSLVLPFLTLVSLLFTFSCQTLDELADSINVRTENFSANLEKREIERDWDAENWDIPQLDTARSVEYLTPEEKNVILELNKVRTNPKKYSDLYLVPTLDYYHKNDFRYPGKITRITNEGRSAADECIKALSSAQPLHVLLPSEALTLAAIDHVLDTGPAGIIGHTGSDGSSVKTRVNRHDKSIRYIAETIAYGPSRAREIIMSLIIDDGVPSRGHRKAILMEELEIVGLSIGKHSSYGYICVIDYARTTTE